MKAGILIGHMNHKGNEASLIRTAEAFGINHIFVIGKREKEYNNAQGGDQHVTFFELKTLREFVKTTRKYNFKMVCIENISESIPITEVEKYPTNPIFITGNEGSGVPKELLDQCEITVKIEQAPSYVRCLNTTIAASIVIHDWFTKQQIRKGWK